MKMGKIWKKIWKRIKRQLEWMSWSCAWSESGAGLYMSAEEFFKPLLEKEAAEKGKKGGRV